MARSRTTPSRGPSANVIATVVVVVLAVAVVGGILLFNRSDGGGGGDTGSGSVPAELRADRTATPSPRRTTTR